MHINTKTDIELNYKFLLVFIFKTFYSQIRKILPDIVSKLLVIKKILLLAFQIIKSTIGKKCGKTILNKNHKSLRNKEILVSKLLKI